MSENENGFQPIWVAVQNASAGMNSPMKSLLLLVDVVAADSLLLVYPLWEWHFEEGCGRARAGKISMMKSLRLLADAAAGVLRLLFHPW